MLQKKLTSSVRIIAGQWRGRKIFFPDISCLRPTQDRIRETLFNWLANDIGDAICLDLFAGSGALGFEALSRGATHVTFVDESREVVAAIKQNAKQFDATDLDVYQASIPCSQTSFIKPCYDIVFLDPPFDQQLFLPAVQWLRQSALIHSETLVYFEIVKNDITMLEEIDCVVIKNKSTKRLAYGLLQLIC